MKELYVSIDVETDGPIPAVNSMLSLGAAAFTLDDGCVGTWSSNLHVLPEAETNADTMKWWEGQPAAWAACRENLTQPLNAMKEFVDWVDDTAKAEGKKPVCVAYPAGFDFMFVYWYMIKFAGRSPFSFSCLDIKSYVSAVLKKPFRQSTKRNMPKRWFSGRRHTHLAVDDALEQGELFMNILKENLK